MEREPLLYASNFDRDERQRLDCDGHLMLPGILTEQASQLGQWGFGALIIPCSTPIPVIPTDVNDYPNGI
jgi:hypothetical protein